MGKMEQEDKGLRFKGDSPINNPPNKSATYSNYIPLPPCLGTFTNESNCKSDELNSKSLD